MKKILTVIALVLPIALFSACGSKSNVNSTNADKDVSTVQSSKIDNKENISKDAYEKSDLLKLTYEGRFVDYAVDIPAGWISKGSSTGRIVDSEDLYIAIDQYSDMFHEQYKYSLDNIKTSNDVFSKMSKQFIDVSSNEHISLNKIEPNITSTKNMKINGFDMTRFEGYITAPKDKVKDNKCQMIGYSTLMQGKPVYFVIVDRTKDQTKKEEMTKLIDAMAKTFRERK